MYFSELDELRAIPRRLRFDGVFRMSSDESKLVLFMVVSIGMGFGWSSREIRKRLMHAWNLSLALSVWFILSFMMGRASYASYDNAGTD